MKNLTKKLLAATLTLGAVSANASILNDNTLASDAWLSVYDSTSKQTFTLDLGAAAGLTSGSLLNEVNNAEYSVSVDLSVYADWNAFKSSADLSTTKYAVLATGVGSDFTPKLLLTGSNATKFNGFVFSDMNSAAGGFNVHAEQINSDQIASDTTFVADSDNPLGSHAEGAGSSLLWGTTAYNPNGQYGEAVDFHLATIDVSTFSGVQTGFAATQDWKLADDSLTFGVSAVPVPAAVWMFGSALLGLVGVSRKRKAV